MKQKTLGVLVGNRDFFPDQLISEGRNDILTLFESMGITAIIPDEEMTRLGAVETWQDVKACTDLFKTHRDKIDGIVVLLPNFGNEKAIADTIRRAELNVPILVQAYPDALDEFHLERRRDAFCGKISVCNNLLQYGHPFSLTSTHTVNPKDELFKSDLIHFIQVCSVVRGLRNVRLGAIGARPGAFNTVRYSEKILEAYGTSVVTVDFSEILGNTERLADTDPSVQSFLERIESYLPAPGIKKESLTKMAKLGVVIENWMQENELQASAIQCWNSLQQNYGINVCTLMSMMSEQMMPSACEVDITGVLSMYVLQLASGTPSALVDWNNNYGDDPEKCVLFHCGNWAKSFYDQPRMAFADVLGTTLGKENTAGAINGRVPAGPMSFARLSTDDTSGSIIGYIGDGQFTDDELKTFGSRAVVQIDNLQSLMQFICENGFEHHTAMNAAYTADVLEEALVKYMGWEIYRHNG
ncbi:fucose isomerase [candidate division KSB1 bacterium]|nr:fucose isomerase [candidate division KSB1 bacterium]